MATDDSLRSLQRKTAGAGALLLVIAFATGGMLAAAMTGKLDAEPRVVSAAHLNAIFGCLWLVALALTLPLLKFGLTGARRLVLVTLVPAYANWLVTLIKSFLHVAGVDAGGETANRAVFAALTALVVIPSFLAAIGWTYGLFARDPGAAK